MSMIEKKQYQMFCAICGADPSGNAGNQFYIIPGAPAAAGYFAVFLGRFAPYLERAFMRLATPAVSNVPRMMW